MSWHYLAEQGEGYWEGSSLDGAPSALSSLIPTLGGSCFQGKEMAPLTDSPSGTMPGHSTEPPGGVPLISSQQDGPAPTLAQRDRARALGESSLGSGLRWPDLSLRFDPDMLSWRIHPCLLGEGLIVSSPTLPRFGTMQSGLLSEHLSLGHRIRESAFGSSAHHREIYTTPTAHNAKETNAPSESERRTPTLAAQIGGKINPQLTEWLMGWPINWTDCDALEMGKFQQWLDMHSCSSLGRPKGGGHGN